MTDLGTIVTDVDILQFESDLHDWAAAHGLTDPPGVEIVRFVMNGDNAPMKSCLEEAGVQFSYDEDGNYFTFPEELDADNPATLEYYTCMAKFPC